MLRPNELILKTDTDGLSMEKGQKI